MGERRAWTAFLFAVLGCGRVSDDRPRVSPGTGGAAASGEAAAGSESSASGGRTAAGGADTGLAGAGAPGCRFSDAGGNAGTSSAAGMPSVEPQVSASWSFSACGVIPAFQRSALQALFLPGGGSLAVLYDDGSVLLHSLASSGAPKVMRAPGDALQAIAVSPDGTQRAELNGGFVQLRRVADGALLSAMDPSDACTARTLRFSAEGDYILAWDRESLCVWEAQSGALTRQLNGAFSSAALSNGRLLTAEYGQPPTVRSWRLAGSGSTAVVLQLPADASLLDSANLPTGDDAGIVLSPRADSVAAPIQSPKLNLGAGIWAADGTLRTAVSNTTYAPEIAYSESGAFVSAGGKLIDAGSGRAVFDIPQGWSTSTIDDRGTWVAGIESIGNAESAVHVFGPSGATGPRLLASLPRSAAVTDISVSPDGSRLVTTAVGGGMLWRIAPDFAASEAIQALHGSLLFEANFTKDGRQVLLSGDGWAAFSAEEGQRLPPPFDTPPPPADVPAFDDQNCVHTSARVSSRGTWLALGTYLPSTKVFGRSSCSTPSLALPTAHCNARTAFSADERLIATTGPALYRTSDGSRIWPALLDPAGPGDLFGDVQFMPGEQALLASNCPGTSAAAAPGCSYALYSVRDGSQIQSLPQLSGAQAAISAEGHWVVSGGTALHLPSGQLRSFDPDALLATFAPNGDIIAVRKDNSIARYCRSP